MRLTAPEGDGIAIVDTLHPALHDAAYLAWGFAATGHRESAPPRHAFEPRFDEHFQLHLQGDRCSIHFARIRVLRENAPV